MLDQYSLVQINSKNAPRNPPYDQKHVSMSLQFPDLSHTAQNKNTWQLFQIRNVQPIPTHPHNVQPILIWSRSMFNPSSQDQDSRSNTVERFWIIGAKNSPVHQRRQMKCLLVAITILLHSLFSLSLSQYLCHGLHNFSLFLRSYITKLRDHLRLMSSFVQISNAWLAFDDGRSNAFLWLSF